jgi:20S proteasome alpha/beta subunit
VSDVADRQQECTQSYIRRPYGVGLLVAGVDVRCGGLSGALWGVADVGLFEW